MPRLLVDPRWLACPFAVDPRWLAHAKGHASQRGSALVPHYSLASIWMIAYGLGHPWALIGHTDAYSAGQMFGRILSTSLAGFRPTPCMFFPPALVLFSCRDTIKPPRSSVLSLPRYHASPLSNPCPLRRKVLGRRGTPLATATSPSAGTLPIRTQELTCSTPERHITVPMSCADCSGSPIILAICLSLAWPRDC